MDHRACVMGTRVLAQRACGAAILALLIASGCGAERSSETRSDDDVDLLRAVPTTLRVSSAYEGRLERGQRLVDGDLETAWSSRTGDLVGAWVEVELPADASVRAILLTAGFTRREEGLDLFTNNHRIAEVRVSRDGADLGTFSLNVESRELQRLAVAGGGGTYRITVTRVVEGSRSDWREVYISELRVMGTAPETRKGGHTPRTPVERPPGIEPDLASSPAPAPVRDAVYFSVDRRGLVRLSRVGTEVLFRGKVQSFAVDAFARVYILTSFKSASEPSRLLLIADEQRRELPLPYDDLLDLALDRRGTPTVISPFGIYRGRDGGWQRPERMDTTKPEDHAEQPQALIIAPDGTVWARGQQSLFSDSDGEYRREPLPGAGYAIVEGVAVGRSGVVAAVTSSKVFVRREYLWETFADLGTAARTVAVGPDGTVVAGGNDAVVLIAPNGALLTVPLPGAGIITALARDPQGRTWVGSTGGLFVLARDGSILSSWSSEEMPGFGLPGDPGAVRKIVISGIGPELLP